MSEPLRTDEYGWKFRTVTTTEQVAFGSVQRRARGVYLARCADEAGDWDEVDAMPTLAAAKRWVKDSGDPAWKWGRWEYDATADAWYISATDDIEREVEA